MSNATIPSIHIGARKVGLDEPCFIIAEAGSNHDGRLEQAYRLIDLAREAGADAVKFQIFRASALYPPTAGKSDYLGDERNIFDIIKAMEMPLEWLPLLSKRCREQGIAFMASAFDEASVDLLDPYVDAFKVASYEMTHTPLLQHTARKGKPIVFSTGTAKLVEVGEAIEAVRATGNNAMIVLQCTAAYPAPLEAIDARVLVTMREVFGVQTGLSDHSRDAIVAPMTAVALGATVIEKHYTLSNRLAGPDHPFAIEPNELFEMVRRIREVEKARGKGEKDVHGVEEELRAFARRTVFTTRAVQKGELVTTENTAVLRAGKLEHGLPPRDYPSAIGKPFAASLDAWATVKPADVALEAAQGDSDGLALRPATTQDAGLVWVWNNEPESRKASIQSDPIPWASHQRWLSARLAEPETSFWIATTKADGAIGSIRIERKGEEDQISLALTKGARGKGFGARIIQKAVAARQSERPIVALVKSENEASAKAFLRAGFVANGQREISGLQMNVYVMRSGKSA